MSSKGIAIFRNIGIGFVFLFGIVSCENDLEDIAVDLTGQRPFRVGDTILEVIAYHRNVDSSRVDNNDSDRVPQFLLGVNTTSNFGALKGDLIAQLTLPLLGADFGDNAVIDRVVLDIPYHSTRDGDQPAVDPITGVPIEDEDGDTIFVPNFTLDSIYGNEDLAYQIEVFELGTFLNSLDPDDPTKSNVYYSDKVYDKLDQLHDGDFKPNRNDTVIYIERRYLDDDPSTVDDIDTIVAANSAPSMKFDLDEQFFKQRFIDHDNPSDFENDGNFARYFRGLYIEASGFDGSLANLAALNARMTIYYTNDEIVDEAADEDLNNNGVNGEFNVVVRTKQEQNYGFGGVITGYYERNYAGSKINDLLMNPNTVNGESELYVQGAAGSEIIIDIFDQETIDFLKQQSLLINEANIVVYLDGDQDEIPEKLHLYKADFHSQINDFLNFSFGTEAFGGDLEYDEDGNPEKYKFRITNYVTSLIKADGTEPISKLALKNYVSTDVPNAAIIDSVVKDWSFIPKGVVLHGNRPADNDKRIKLEVFYSD